MTDPNIQESSAKPYIALSFDTIKYSSDGQKEWDLCSDRMTNLDGQDRDHPLKVYAGKYFLTLKVLQDQPKGLRDEEGNTEFCYLKKMWHMEPEGRVHSNNKSFQIAVVCKRLDGSIGEEPRYETQGSDLPLLPLGEIDLKRGDYELKLVGEVHRCFWSQSRYRGNKRYLAFKKVPTGRNLTYYISVQ